MQVLSQCWKCSHYKGKSSCDAFDDIPPKVFTNEHNHKKKYPGDKGIIFKPLPSVVSVENNDQR